MTAIEPLTNLSGTRGGGIPEATRENAVHADCFAATTGNDTARVRIPPAQKLCPDCESREIAQTEDLCVICWFARNDENPDGRWVNTNHAGWLYE